MSNTESLQLFEDQPIRTAWDADAEEWYFSIVDVVGVLTEQPDTRHAAKYWSVLKTRLKKEGSELPTNCSQLKLKSPVPKSPHESFRSRSSPLGSMPTNVSHKPAVPSQATPEKIWSNASEDRSSQSRMQPS